MKYIKLFESNLYDRITYSQFAELQGGLGYAKLRPMDVREINKIQPLNFELTDEDYLTGLDKIGCGEYLICKDTIEKSIRTPKKKVEDIAITKLDDDWYILHYKDMGFREAGTKSRYFKCDQIEGIADCLKNELGI